MLYGVEDQPRVTALGGGYTAGAIHWTGGSNALIRASLTASNRALFSMSFWSKGLCTSGNNGGQIFVVDPDTDFTPGWAISTGGRIDGQNHPSGVNGEFDFTIAAAAMTSGVWHHLLFSQDTSGSAGARKVALYVDRSLISFSYSSGSGNFYATTDSAPAITVPYSAKKFAFGDDTFGDGPTCDFADVWIAPGISLLDGTGLAISGTNLNKFNNAGHPADPAGFPSSAILFSGNAASFATNQGTGGAFTLSGSLSNASSHP